MWAVVQTVLVLAFLSYWLYRAETLYRDYVRQSEPAELESVEPIPDDLVGFARTFGSDWAREQTLAAISEHYSKLGDWQKVRQALNMTAGTM